MQTKFIFITGGVVSGLGKGIVASSLGYLLKSKGFNSIKNIYGGYASISEIQKS